MTEIPLYQCENCGIDIYSTKDACIGVLTVLCWDCAKQLLGREK